MKHTDNIKPAGDGNPKAGGVISDLDLPSNERFDKTYSTLRAAYALKGHVLHRTNPADGPVTFWAERWGLARYLPTIDTVRRILEQIGGRL